MVTEMSQAETCRVNQERKRQVKYDAPKMATSATQTEEVKRPRMDAPAPAPALPANKGWGELFKNRETFVDMHIC